MRYVLVEWKDATMEGGWHDKDHSQLISGAVAHTIGFVIAEDVDWLKLAQSTSTNEDGNLTEIPKAWITKVTPLGELDASAEV